MENNVPTCIFKHVNLRSYACTVTYVSVSMPSKNKDFDSLGLDLAAAAGPLPVDTEEKRKPGRPPVETVQFTIRITLKMRKQLAKLAAKEQDQDSTGKNVTPQMIAVRILEEHLKNV